VSFILSGKNRKGGMEGGRNEGTEERRERGREEGRTFSMRESLS
jgi:hypothetical protein